MEQLADNDRALSLDEALSIAILLQQNEQWAAADDIYRRVLEVAPDYADAVHYSGVLAHQQGRSEQAVALIEDMEVDVARGEAIRWGIAPRGQPEVIGFCGFAAWRKRHRRGEVGYILSRDHWKSGVMREVLSAVLAYGFGAMDLHSVEAGVTPGNDGSIRLLERSGFRLEGHTRETYWAEDRFVDSLIFSLLRRDWEATTTEPHRPG